MHRAHRCTLANTVRAPTGANRTLAHCRRFQGARRAAPPSLPRAAARPTRPTIPRAPRPRIRPTARARPCAHCTSITYALLPAARVPLCRHRADPESSSRSLPSGSSARIAPIAPTARIAPHRARRPPLPAFPSRVASAPGPWLARIAPHASLFRRMREKGPLPGNFCPKCMLFEIKMATSSPYASISGRNRAIQDTWRANLAAKGPLSRRETRNHAWREDVASAARPFSGSSLRSGGTGFAPCDSGMRHAAWPNGLCALRRGPGLLAACAPPAISLVPAAACASPPSRPRSSPPSYTRRASPSETRHAVPAPMHLATCAPHPSRQPRGPTASRKQAEQRKQLNAGIKIGSPNGDPIEELFGLRSVCPTPYSPYTKRTNLRFPTWITAPDRDSGATL